MNARKREIPVLFLRGSEELARATGFTDKRVHAKWREDGLPYSVDERNACIYYVKDVVDFIKKRYAPQQVKINL